MIVKCVVYIHYMELSNGLIFVYKTFLDHFGASTSVKRQFLCHSVNIRTCCVKTREDKRSHKEYQSGSCLLGGGNQVFCS